jgi:putative transcriptional regulator
VPIRAIALCFVAAVAAVGQQAALDRPGPGRFLVAEEQVLDPNFSRSVVLLIDYGAEGAMGLIVNRPARLTLTEALPSVEALQGRRDRIFFGGPVSPEGLLLLLRADRGPEGFEPVFQDVHLGGGAATLAGLLIDGVPSSRLRGYAGYAGWGPGQLDNEIDRGDWSIVSALPSQVFDPTPETLWQRLMEQRRIRFASGW